MKWLAALLLALAPTGALAAPKTITRLDAGWQVRIAPADKAASKNRCLSFERGGFADARPGGRRRRSAVQGAASQRQALTKDGAAAPVARRSAAVAYLCAHQPVSRMLHHARSCATFTPSTRPFIISKSA